MNYNVTKKEFLAVVFGFQKFGPYLIESHVIGFIDHATLKHLFEKNNAKPWLIRWILLLQEFDFDIKDMKGSKNLITDHLSRIAATDAI